MLLLLVCVLPFAVLSGYRRLLFAGHTLLFVYVPPFTVLLRSYGPFFCTRPVARVSMCGAVGGNTAHFAAHSLLLVYVQLFTVLLSLLSFHYHWCTPYTAVSVGAARYRAVDVDVAFPFSSASAVADRVPYC